MAWKPRICGENIYHHIYAWSNDRHPIFKIPGHYERYLLLLKKYSSQYDIDIIAYALMEWHVHLFVHDKTNNISSFMFRLHGSYAHYYNRINKRAGHVFGERYNNKVVIPNQYGIWLSRYIHRQALEAGLVKDIKDYPWTSYRYYIDDMKSSFISSAIILNQFGKGKVAIKYYNDFVLREVIEEPVDWGRRIFKIKNSSSIMSTICKELMVDVSKLINPKGNNERNQRKAAIELLHYKYNYTKSQIAEIFRISRAAVTLCLRANINKK
ncbi:hypothetical protein A2Y85_00285 [candidate division WOR-3 bacterium RBG_13_43_14]|uniref:Transposase IS200-like domain-containing protein n=1 Tax=candidate division WOR-3 bacterium RBG_13_43_14 TaxID=1802590 RepID=A0A1F4U2U0_UNCW3|nr:MAG: hypothetical protein A2Y85_00285 [candidate division WOR-3 bacterium RBG_13_43_14]